METRYEPTSPVQASIRLYPRDWRRLVAVRDHVIHGTGRPCSVTDVVLYLLDHLDPSVGIELSSEPIGVAS